MDGAIGMDLRVGLPARSCVYQQARPHSLRTERPDLVCYISPLAANLLTCLVEKGPELLRLDRGLLDVFALHVVVLVATSFFLIIAGALFAGPALLLHATKDREIVKKEL